MAERPILSWHKHENFHVDSQLYYNFYTDV